MQEDVIYRCINPACARPMPRRVNFCPWCGTAQGQALPRPDPQPHAGREAAVAAAASAGAEAVAAMSGWTDVPVAPDVLVPPARAAAAAPPGSDAASGASGNGTAGPGAEAARPELGKAGTRTAPAAPSATGFGHSAAQGAGAGSVPPRQEVPRPPIPARPRQRRPVQLRWWILALAILWGVWLWAKPSSRKIDQRIERAEALARECKGNEAQAELIALRSSRATPAQLERLQKSLNEEAATCTRRRQRNKAWSEASAAAEAALDAGSIDKARTRLQGFIRRWGEDGKTRALKEKIDAAAERQQHPLAVPPGQA